MAMAALVSVIFACGGETSAPGDSGPVGSWQLESVAGKPLPFVYSAGVAAGVAYKSEYLSVTLTMYSDGKYLIAGRERETHGATSTLSNFQETGRWSIATKSLALTSDEDGSTTTGTINGNTMTITTSLGPMLFKR
jgi:hypothetical protein